jgi:hypothetical protein
MTENISSFNNTNNKLNFLIVHVFFLADRLESKKFLKKYEMNKGSESEKLEAFEKNIQICHWIKPSYLEELSKRISIDKKNGTENTYTIITEVSDILIQGKDLENFIAYYEIIHKKLEDFCKKLEEIYNLKKEQFIVKKFSSLSYYYSDMLQDSVSSHYRSNERGKLIDQIKNYALGNYNLNERVFLVDWDAIANEQLINDISKRKGDIEFQLLTTDFYKNACSIIDHGCILRNNISTEFQKLLQDINFLVSYYNPIDYMHYCILKHYKLASNLTIDEKDLRNEFGRKHNQEKLLNEWKKYIHTIETPIQDNKIKGLTWIIDKDSDENIHIKTNKIEDFIDKTDKEILNKIKNKNKNFTIYESYEIENQKLER